MKTNIQNQTKSHQVRYQGGILTPFILAASVIVLIASAVIFFE